MWATAKIGARSIGTAVAPLPRYPTSPSRLCASPPPNALSPRSYGNLGASNREQRAIHRPVCELERRACRKGGERARIRRVRRAHSIQGGEVARRHGQGVETQGGYSRVSGNDTRSRQIRIARPQGKGLHKAVGTRPQGTGAGLPDHARMPHLPQGKGAPYGHPKERGEERQRGAWRTPQRRRKGCPAAPRGVCPRHPHKKKRGGIALLWSGEPQMLRMERRAHLCRLEPRKKNAPS